MQVRENTVINSISYFRIKKYCNNFTLLNIKLETGKTHQIRLHFSNINYPILKDKLYTSKNINLNKYSFLNIKTQMLHAKYLKFFHPYLNKNLSFFSYLPQQFDFFIKNND